MAWHDVLDTPTSVLGVLRERMVRLGRDEDGAALVITLAIFFLMYLGCMGVYAISMAVKERIQLQNAADAAAYSAAVVQADTLSRIATINRAMSWTYVNMTRRQLDYITYRWLKHTYKHFQQDSSAASRFHSCSGHCKSGHTGTPRGWMTGVGELHGFVQLNGFDAPPLFATSSTPVGGLMNMGSTVPIETVNATYLAMEAKMLPAIQEMGGQIAQIGSLKSFVDGLASEMGYVSSSNAQTVQSVARMVSELNGPNNKADIDTGSALAFHFLILWDRVNIAAMNIAERNLAHKMPQKIKNVVYDTIRANVPPHMQDKCLYYLKQNEDPLADEELYDPNGLVAKGYFENLYNYGYDECRFMKFAGYKGTPVDVLNKSLISYNTIAGGIEQWFVRGNGWRRTDKGIGLQRSYKHWADGPRASSHAAHSPDPPSCYNTVNLHGSPQTIALHSSWEWHSGKWICYDGVFVHFHIGYLFLSSCNHGSSKKDWTGQITSLVKLATSLSQLGSFLSSALGGVRDPDDCGENNDIHSYLKPPPIPDPNSLGRASSPVESYDDVCRILFDWLRLADSRGEELILPWHGYSRLYGDAPHLYNSAYVGERAKPLILKSNYFGKEGTIGVGIRRKNENVFLRFLKTIGGVFKAFDPDWNEDKDTHTYVFASAKAGYREKGSTQSQDDYSSRAYRIDWNPADQDWNLCQSDWDAVFVPVRKAYSYALLGIWQDGDDDMLDDWIVGDADKWKPVSGNGGGDYMCDNIYAPGGILRGNGHDGTLKWRELSHVMFH